MYLTMYTAGHTTLHTLHCVLVMRHNAYWGKGQASKQEQADAIEPHTHLSEDVCVVPEGSEKVNCL